MHSNETQTYPAARKCSPVSHRAILGYWTLLRFPTLFRSPGALADVSPDLSPPGLLSASQVTAAVNTRGRSVCRETLRRSLEI
jgi:hypothetical protein